MVDVERLRALLDRLRDVETELERLRQLGPEVVRGDVDLLNSTKYMFVVAAEVAIDAGQHVIASEGLPVPRTFAGVFDELGRGRWLEPTLATSMAAMARFRNLLGHGYADVDDDRVVEILATRIGDLSDFRRQIAAGIEGRRRSVD
jgi:uncharacterized protein YutE (UPF0331/DUF86 family)